LENLELKKLEEVITKPFDHIDGPRLTNELVIYTYPNIKTNQNVFGYEVAVDKYGVVTQKDVLVTISQGGFAISGHGTQKEFIQEHIQLGFKVEYDVLTNQLKITNHKIDSIIFNLNIAINKSLSRMNEVSTKLMDVNDLDNAQRSLEKIQTIYDRLKALSLEIKGTYDNQKVKDFLQLNQDVKPVFDQIFLDTMVSRRIETRGIWHRPNEKSLSDIQHTLDVIASLNFTDVYLETFWNGYVIYKSDLAPYHVIFNNADFGYYDDYLSAFMTEAKKRNIEVHAWVENFFVGVSWKHSNLWELHENWRNVDINDNQIITGKPGGDEAGYLFFDPANPDARKFLLNLYKEMIGRGLNSLQLDYIRYPSGNHSVKYSTGYTGFAINEFKVVNNYEGDLKKEVLTNPELYIKWHRYRQEVINSFVKEVHEKIRVLNPDISLSIAVGPDHQHAKEDLVQDWRLWVENGWIDGVKPMGYVNDMHTLSNIITKSKTITKKLSYNFTAIAPAYYNLPSMYNAYYIESTILSGTQGVAIFAAHNVIGNDEVCQLLLKGPFQNRAISATSPMQEILKVFIEDLMSKFDRYIVHNLSVESKKKLLQEKLEPLKLNSYKTLLELKELYKNFKELKSELFKYASDIAITRLNEAFDYIMQIIDIRISRVLVLKKMAISCST